mgnify:CR=1 FL=1
MKLLLTGDWHITDKKPENRVDNYWEIAKRKIIFILQTAREEKINVILQPGDFTDSPSMQWNVFIELKQLFYEFEEIKIFSIYGQHDLRYRNKGNTVLDALEASCSNIRLSWGEPFIYSSSYNEEIPKIRDSKEFNILLIHRMILQEKIWSGQTEYSDAANFLRTNPFQLVVSGDNHQGFICDQKITGKQLFNCGALLRSKIDQVDHKPFIVIYDTETREYKQIFVPIEPPEKVFNLEKVMKEKEKNENLEAFVVGLSGHKEIGMKFEDNLNVYMNEIGVEPDIRQIIEEAKI